MGESSGNFPVDDYLAVISQREMAKRKVVNEPVKSGKQVCVSCKYYNTKPPKKKCYRCYRSVKGTVRGRKPCMRCDTRKVNKGKRVCSYCLAKERYKQYRRDAKKERGGCVTRFCQSKAIGNGGYCIRHTAQSKSRRDERDG